MSPNSEKECEIQISNDSSSGSQDDHCEVKAYIPAQICFDDEDNTVNCGGAPITQVKHLLEIEEKPQSQTINIVFDDEEPTSSQ